ncbi:related to 6-hydroxy-D-nicotine oxidase [Phialocephala subalpina]|uniref:Related to 6-hydroxy-D-nicotine oxidase n=1 Tax=Phialocephala subalpina TaxID=576137 RepID=A0A1L7XRV8_9HELO|nr:related to 6-hydroxy-D-nicotine oxidase [Phialocephala subalpina]
MAPITSDILSKLKAAFPEIVILTPASPEYEKSMERYFRSAEHQAGAVIYPRNVDDVADILRFSTNHKIDLAVCGVGHNGKGNSIENGLVIDLRKMTSVSVNPIKKTITTQGAAMWSDIYAEAEKYDLAAVGGVTPSVGVGGFTINGGYSWLNGAHGMGCDNLFEAEVVLADGRVMICSEKENEDLFWAMKGAGSIFGIVTKFVLKAHEQKNLVWKGEMGFKRSQLRGVCDVINKTMGEENNGGKASVLMLSGVLPGTSEVGIILIPWYNGPEDEAKTFFAPLLEMEPIFDTTKMMPFSQSGVEGGGSIGREWRKVIVGGSLMAPLDATWLGTMFEDLENLINTLPDAATSVIGFEFHNPVATMKIGQTETAYPDRGTHGTMFLSPTWTKEENDAVCRKWCEKEDAKMIKEFRKRQGEKQVDNTTRTSSGRYPNYDYLGLSPKEVYGVNYERILSLKKKYDPGNVFKEYVDLFLG